MPFQPGFKGRAPLLVAFQASAVGTGAIACPAVNAGDLIVTCTMAQNNNFAPVEIDPSGFTRILSFALNDVAGHNTRIMAWYKIAAGTEGGTNLGGMNGGIRNRRYTTTFRGTTGLISGVSINSVNTEHTDGNPAAQNIASGSGVIPLIAFAGYFSTGAVDPRGFSPAADGELTANADSYFKYKVYDSAPANIAVDMDDEGNNNMLCSFYLALTGS